MDPISDHSGDIARHMMFLKAKHAQDQVASSHDRMERQAEVGFEVRAQQT